MTTRAYDKFFLPGMMKNLGFAVDFAVNGCGLSCDSFYDFFIASKVAREIENGSPIFVGGCSGTDQVRHDLYRVTALDGGADRHGAHAVPDDAALVTAVGLQVETHLVAMGGHVDIARREFHQRCDVVQEFVFSDAAQGRYDFEGRERARPASEHFCDFHSRWDRKSRACSAVNPRLAA